MANLEDLIDPEYGLQQDEWSLTRPKFGEEGQLEVIGWSGKSKEGRKLYLVSCRLCSGDAELFGDGVFRSAKNNLNKDQTPCGCSNRPDWSADQIITRLNRKSLNGGYKFCYLVGEYQGVKKTKCVVCCPLHGEWDTTVDNILQGRGCHSCRQEKLTHTLRTKGNRTGSQRQDDSLHIEGFMATGGFVQGTKFSRNLERKTAKGRLAYWNIYCPECNTTSTAFHGQLKDGQRSCGCSPRRHKQAYISVLIDMEVPMAVKFGIANNAIIRNRQQNRTSVYPVKGCGVWEFETKGDCVSAERECKQTLECGILTKEEMPDGWSETVDVKDLEKIISIYEKHGGVRIEDVSNNLET